MPLSINEFRTLFRANGCPLATVLFAVNETTGRAIGEPGWDNPQPLPFEAPSHPADRMERPRQSAAQSPYGRYR